VEPAVSITTFVDSGRSSPTHCSLVTTLTELSRLHSTQTRLIRPRPHFAFNVLTVHKHTVRTLILYVMICYVLLYCVTLCYVMLPYVILRNVMLG
jgi:hypothetical protein